MMASASQLPSVCTNNKIKLNFEEQWYCKLFKMKPMAINIHEFNRNDKNAQYLLLKMAAKSRSIKLPAQPQVKQKKQKKKLHKKSKKSKKGSNREISPHIHGGLKGCILKKNKIRCQDNRVYDLQKNKTTKYLRKGALSDKNKLNIKGLNQKKYQHLVQLNLRKIIKNKQLSAKTKVAIQDYYRLAYQRYIMKMLDIGLGGSAMRWFIFHEGRVGDLNQRLEKTFSYLKQQRKELMVKKNKPVRKKLSIKDCEDVSDTIIVCAKKVNWVYLLANKFASTIR